MQPSGLVRIRWILGGVFLATLVSYAVFTSWSYLEGPQIEVYFPEKGYSTSSPTVTLVGKAEHISHITINDRAIFIDEKGNIKETLLLAPGPSIIKLYARDRFEREVEIVLPVYRTSPYTPALPITEIE